MKKINKLSIITITLNCEKTIERTIQSVQSQTYPQLEYLLIDGESSDGTIKIVNKYSEVIDCFSSSKDSGVYNAMNKGIKNATGDVIFFLNGDDYFCDYNVSSDMMSYFNNRDELDLVYGDVLLDYPDGLKRWNQYSEFSRKNLARSTINHQSIFCRKSSLLRTNGFSEEYRIVSDYAWLMELVHSDVVSMHVARDVAVVGTEGLSYKTEWKAEKYAAMKKYYTLQEIFLWRLLPETIKSVVGMMKWIYMKSTNNSLFRHN